jgi:hypothetical protein
VGSCGLPFRAGYFLSLPALSHLPSTAAPAAFVVHPKSFIRRFLHFNNKACLHSQNEQQKGSYEICFARHKKRRLSVWLFSVSQSRQSVCSNSCEVIATISAVNYRHHFIPQTQLTAGTRMSGELELRLLLTSISHKSTTKEYDAVPLGRPGRQYVLIGVCFRWM